MNLGLSFFWYSRQKMWRTTLSSVRLSVSGSSLLKKSSGSGVSLDLAGKPGKGWLGNLAVLHLATLEPGDVLPEPQIPVFTRAVAVLGHLNGGYSFGVGLVGVVLLPLLTLGVHLLAVYEHDHVSVLLYAAAVSEIGELGGGGGA